MPALGLGIRNALCLLLSASRCSAPALLVVHHSLPIVPALLSTPDEPVRLLAIDVLLVATLVESKLAAASSAAQATKQAPPVAKPPPQTAVSAASAATSAARFVRVIAPLVPLLVETFLCHHSGNEQAASRASAVLVCLADLLPPAPREQIVLLLWQALRDGGLDLAAADSILPVEIARTPGASGSAVGGGGAASVVAGLAGTVAGALVPGEATVAFGALTADATDVADRAAQRAIDALCVLAHRHDGLLALLVARLAADLPLQRRTECVVRQLTLLRALVRVVGVGAGVGVGASANGTDGDASTPPTSRLPASVLHAVHVALCELPTLRLGVASSDESTLLAQLHLLAEQAFALRDEGVPSCGPLVPPLVCARLALCGVGSANQDVRSAAFALVQFWASHAPDVALLGALRFKLEAALLSAKQQHQRTAHTLLSEALAAVRRLASGR